MGLSNNTVSIVYLNMKHGKFARKNTNGDIELFDSVDGVITKVEFVDDEYNGEKYRKLAVTLEDGSEKFLVQVRTDSGYFRGLTNAIANADISAKVKLVGSSKVGENGKPQTTIFVNQHGKALKWKWSKEHPGDLPALKKVKLKGKEVYDNEAQQAFFEKFWMTLPIAKAAPVAEVGESDELPF